MFDVPSDAAERTSGQLMRELARYDSLRRAARPYGGGRLTPKQREEQQIAANAIVSSMTIVEDFTVVALQERIAREFSGHVMHDETLKSVSKGLENSWNDRLEYLQKWFVESPNPTGPIVQVQVFIQLRNSIVHGRGGLTRRQLGGKDSGKSLLARYRQIEVSESGGLLMIPPRCVVLGVRRSREFVLELDAITARSELRASAASRCG